MYSWSRFLSRVDGRTKMFQEKAGNQFIRFPLLGMLRKLLCPLLRLAVGITRSPLPLSRLPPPAPPAAATATSWQILCQLLLFTSHALLLTRYSALPSSSFRDPCNNRRLKIPQFVQLWHINVIVIIIALEIITAVTYRQCFFSTFQLSNLSTFQPFNTLLSPFIHFS